MIKLGAGVCFFEKSLPTIQRCIESIRDNVDYIFGIDGRFTDELGRALFPDTEKLSPQYVRDYLKTVPNCILVDYPATEVQKRQRYLDLCRQYECQFLLIIDSDEFVMEGSDWKSFRYNLNQCTGGVHIYGVKFAYGYPEHDDETNYPRLWYKPWEMEYYNAHCLFRDKVSGKVSQSSSAAGPLIEGIRMAGDDSLRSREYQVQSFEYQTFLIDEEREIREACK